MRMSKLYIHTLREVPSDLDSSSLKLLLRAGMIRKFHQNQYVYLPLGYKVVNRIKQLTKDIIKDTFLEILIPDSLASGKDKFIQVARKDLKSYKELPLGFYCIQPHFKEEKIIKQKALKSGESIMMEGITLDADKENQNQDFSNVHELFEELLAKCGISILPVDDNFPTEEETLRQVYFAPTDCGRQLYVQCKACGYGATLQSAVCGEDTPEKSMDQPLEEVHTPSVTTIDDLVQFMDTAAQGFIKCLLFKAENKFIAALLRGDRELNFKKLERILKISPDKLEFASPEEVKRITGAETGFAGPIGLKEAVMIADREVVVMKNATAGANKTDYHFKNVNYGRDYTSDKVADIGLIKEGDKCPICMDSLVFNHGMAVAGLEKSYLTDGKQSVKFIDEAGNEKLAGIGYFLLDISEIMAASVEQNHDENGILWPMSIAPYHVIITVVNVKEKEQMDLAVSLYDALCDSKIDVLLDDRDERAGVKFKDADLIGIPMRIVVGKKAGEGKVEYKLRGEDLREELKYHEALSKVLKELKKAGIK